MRVTRDDLQRRGRELTGRSNPENYVRAVSDPNRALLALRELLRRDIGQFVLASEHFRLCWTTRGSGQWLKGSLRGRQNMGTWTLERLTAHPKPYGGVPTRQSSFQMCCR